MSAREDMVTAALSVCGLAADPDGLYGVVQLDAFLEAVAPGETRARALSMSRMSTCALTVRALWTSIGVCDPRLCAPYIDQHAVSDVYGVAADANALFFDPAQAEPGDVVIVSMPEHVFTITSIESDGAGGYRLTSVDGGTRSNDDKRVQMIQTRSRIWRKGRDYVTDDSFNVGPYPSRAIIAIINTERVFNHFGQVR